MIELNKIYNEDCLEGMKRIPDGSVDMILCDLPYGTTRNEWDVIIPLEQLWSHYNRLIKKNGAIILTASQPFTSALVMSNVKNFRYTLVWEKQKGSDPLNARRKPLKSHEDICVFYHRQPTYNPQFSKAEPYIRKGDCSIKSSNFNKSKMIENRGSRNGDRFPKSVLKFSGEGMNNRNLHPTQKPVELFKYLIRTYTNEGETVLDNCMGSGTTAIACMDTNRNYIGFELDETYYKNSLERIKNHATQTELFDYM